MRIFELYAITKTKLMKISVINKLSEILPYNDIREVSKNFTLDKDKYFGTGKVKKQASSGRSMYAEIKIELEKSEYPSSMSWEVNEFEIPYEYLDTILTTYKSIFDLSNLPINLKIIGGSFHVIDSNVRSFEIATFKAIADVLNFEHEKLNVYRIL